jgi:hypothetical protein
MYMSNKNNNWFILRGTNEGKLSSQSKLTLFYKKKITEQ